MVLWRDHAAIIPLTLNVRGVFMRNLSKWLFVLGVLCLLSLLVYRHASQPEFDRAAPASSSWAHPYGGIELEMPPARIGEPFADSTWMAQVNPAPSAAPSWIVVALGFGVVGAGASLFARRRRCPRCGSKRIGAFCAKCGQRI
jgi:hypothetical protein